MRRRVSPCCATWVAALALALGAGCGDDDGATMDAAVDATPDAVVDAGPDAQAPTQLTVQVSHATPRTDATDVVVGATVALDLPTGGRLEQETGADGRTTFTDIEWDTGTAAVTAHVDGLMLSSWVNLTPADDFVELWLFGQETNLDLVTISGDASPWDPSHTLHVNTGWDVYQAPGPHYFVDVPRNEPFTLMATEYEPFTVPTSPQGVSQTFYAWRVIENSGVSDATTIDLDFSTSTPSYTASGSFQLPARADSPLRAAGKGYAEVSSEDTALNGCYGWPTLIDLAADGESFEYDMEWVEPVGILFPRTLYYLYTGDVSSYVVDYGYPVDGPLGVTLLDAPKMLTPRAWDPPHPLHAAIQYETYDPDVDVRLVILRGGSFVWFVNSHIGFGSITVPPLPSTADASAVLGGSGTSLEAKVQVYDWPPGEPVVHRMALGPPIELEVP